jgi:hypothetical protein
LYVIRAAKDAAGDFFRSVQRQQDHYQGIWIASPEGKVLSSLKTKDVPNTNEGLTKAVLLALDDGIKAFGRVEPRHAKRTNPLPFRGRGCRPDGSVMLAVADRWMPDKGVEGVPNDPAHKAAASFDSFTLTRAEWASLAPPKTVAGQEWTVPEATARKFYTLLSLGDKVFRDPKEVTAVRIAGKVQSVENGIAYLTFAGQIAGKHTGTANEGRKGQPLSSKAKLIGGVGSYDTKAGRMLSLTFVFDGRFRNYPPYDNPASRYGAVVEWRHALAPKEPDGVLFDFEDAADLKAWTNLELPNAKVKEPAARIERSTENATSGKHSLKITFTGGSWPAITSTSIPGDWTKWKTLKADITVSRPCVVGFTVMQERSKRGDGWDETTSRWTKTAFLKPGKNTVSGILRPKVGDDLDPKRGKCVSIEIFMYKPHKGEAIYVDNIRVTAKSEEKQPAKVRFTVAGTDWELIGTNPFGVASAGAVMELGKKLKDQWKKPEVKTVAQIEKEFRAQYAELKKKHPRAILSILRDGEKGYDPAKPDQVYAGWKDAYFSSHGPEAAYVSRAQNNSNGPTQEIFMRHRSPMMRVDLSSIPAGAKILTARLIVVRTSSAAGGERDPAKNPNMWVVEPCNRPWEEHEVNAFEYAKDKFWKEIGGWHWSGEDPDFLPIFLAYGPGQPKVNSWDFTEAVRFWTNGKHLNHGFMLHADAVDYMIGYSRKAKEIKDRPAVLVIYEPK